MPAKKHSIAFKILLAYAAPAVPISALALPLAVHLPAFYAVEMGLGFGVVGTVFLVARLWDIITDPLLGMLADKIPWKWGRRRPWFAISIPIIMVACYAIFLPPAPPVSWLYFLGWLLILYVGWTLLTISHLAWGSELSQNYHTRSTVQGSREMALIGGMILVLLIPIFLEFWGESLWDFTQKEISFYKIAAIGLFTIIVLPFTGALALWLVPDTVAVPTTKKFSWKKSVSLLATNKPLRSLLVVDICYGFYTGIVSSLYIILTRDILQLPNGSILLVIYFLSGIICVPFILRFSYHFGKHRTLTCAMLLNVAVLPAMFFLPVGNMTIALLAFVFLGCNYAAQPTLLRAMMSDVIDQDALSSGKYRSGLFMAFLNMTSKLGIALAIVIGYWFLEWIDFKSGVTISAEKDFYVRAVYVAGPLLANLLGALIVWNFPITAKVQKQNRQKLKQQGIV